MEIAVTKYFQRAPQPLFLPHTLLWYCHKHMLFVFHLCNMVLIREGKLLCGAEFLKWTTKLPVDELKMSMKPRVVCKVLG